ncbi:MULTISPECIES: hypothetical protein [unclassified Pseudomonas]|nr:MULTISPECIES: hypothetical protein [unclassified Pseudomonas]MEB0040073.1 hypothetical protein [Pseudomonas sp. MH10]MEB0122318.1 hypothetical protein [Pseudomonas sp. CCI1.2]WPX65416.1 hypothetical protein RHM59_07100 [Pseudomonas sp. MH10]
MPQDAMPFIGNAVDGGVLAHRRHHYAVAQGHALERERFEKG